MPKLKTARRKAPRSGPYPETVSKTPSTTHTTKNHGCTTFPFLDLPFELRLIVYANFLQMTPSYLPRLYLPLTYLPSFANLCTTRMAESQGLHEDHHAISKTRKSLNLVCHQISAEWSPLFYETTTCIVHASKRKLGYFRPKHMSLDQRCNPWIFANDFLRVLQPAKLANIRRITYDIQRDMDSLHDFPKLLMKHIDRLQSLEKLSITWNEQDKWNYGVVRIGDSSTVVWRSVSRQPVWEIHEEHFLGLGKKNQTIRAKRKGAGVLQGWNITRKLRVKHMYYKDRHFRVQAVAIVFKKGGPATTEHQPPRIKILLEG